MYIVQAARLIGTLVEVNIVNSPNTAIPKHAIATNSDFDFSWLPCLMISLQSRNRKCDKGGAKFAVAKPTTYAQTS
jgi:hypothetical protein